MRLVVIAICVMALSASVPALAQPGGVVGIYTDATGTGECSLVESIGSLMSVWVVHTSGPDIQGARFRVSTNWTATYINADYPVLYLVEPDLFGGDYFGTGGCQSAPVWLAQLNYMTFVPTPPCGAEFHVLPDPDASSGEIEVLDCDGNTLVASAGDSWVTVNADETCPCVAPISAQEETWSRIKALYR